MMTTSYSFLKTQTLQQMTQLIKADSCIGGSAEEPPKRLLRCHTDILHRGCEHRSDPAILSPMTTPRRKSPRPPPPDPLSAIKPRKAVPHEFVLEALAALSPHTRSMFGGLAAYGDDQI